ncbi:MAG: glycosyltransferase family 39 protein [Candidatus Omnitrophica bacterium]|nr:glycosyltransferase family 39 protein [Candidatus Omnitrophota bacterium]
MAYRHRLRGLLTDGWVSVLLFLLALWIRSYRIGDQSFYDDEILTTFRISHPFWETIALLRHSPFPPLHYIILKIWANIFGANELTLRLPSLIFSGLTTIVLFHLGKELFHKRVGFIAALLLIFSPFAISHAQSAKMYSLFWFLEASSFLYFFRFLRHASQKAYVSYIISTILCCYTMYVGWIFVIAQNVTFFFWGKREEWKKWCLSQGIIFLVCLPWIIWFVSSTHEKWDFRSAQVDFHFGQFFLRSFFVIFGGAYELMMNKSFSEHLLSLCLWRVNLFIYGFFSVSFLIDQIMIAYKRLNNPIEVPRSLNCLFLWLGISLAMFFLYAFGAQEINLEVRYFGFLQIPLILIIASQINNLPSLIRKMTVCLVLLITASNTAIYLRDVSIYPYQDWRGMARDLTLVLKDDDVVVSSISIPQFQYYFKADASRFYPLPKKWSMEDLFKQGIIKPENNSVYFLYKQQNAPEISLTGFVLDRKASFGGMGYLHFEKND